MTRIYYGPREADEVSQEMFEDDATLRVLQAALALYLAGGMSPADLAARIDFAAESVSITLAEQSRERRNAREPEDAA